VLVGVVRLADGRAPADVHVVVTRKVTPEEVHELRTTADGQVRFERLAPGNHRLRATHPDYAPVSFAFEVAEGAGAGPFDITMNEGGSVVVRVLGPRGTPIENRDVRIREFDTGEPLVAPTDRNGEARFDHVPAGFYWVRCSDAPDGKGPTRDVDVEPGQTAHVLFDLSSALLGTLFDASGAPLPRAHIEFVAVHAGCRLVDASTDDAGHFDVRGAPAGEYRPRVDVPGPGGYVVVLEPIVLATGDTARNDVHIPPGRLEGRVADADTGMPCLDAKVTVQAVPVEVTDGEVRSRDSGWMTAHGWSARYLARADAQGRFSLVGLPSGAYEVWAIADGKAMDVARRVVEVPAMRPPLDFSLPRLPVGTLRVRALERDGSPAAGVCFSEHVHPGVKLSLDERRVGNGVYEVYLPIGQRVVEAYRSEARQKVKVDVVEGTIVELAVTLRSK
jgi:hypothetical protein